MMWFMNETTGQEQLHLDMYCTYNIHYRKHSMTKKDSIMREIMYKEIISPNVYMYME